MFKRTPFEKNWRLLSLFWTERLDLGLMLRVSPRDWLRTFWSHPEADAIWYMIGPFAFYELGIYTRRLDMFKIDFSHAFKDIAEVGVLVFLGVSCVTLFAYTLLGG